MNSTPAVVSSPHKKGEINEVRLLRKQEQHEGGEEERKSRGFDIATYFEMTFKDFQGTNYREDLLSGGKGGYLNIFKTKWPNGYSKIKVK